MNILIFSWRDPKHPLSGGAEQVMHEHAKGWEKAGHKVTLFSSSFNGAKQDEVIDGIRVLRSGSQILGVHFSAMVWYLFINTNKFDLVIDQFHGIPFFTPLYVGIPKLAVLQEIAREVWFLNDLTWPINKIVGFLGYYLERYLFGIYKKVPFIVGSESAKEDLINFGVSNKNITVVPHGVLTLNKKIIYKKEKNLTILFLGAIAKDKGIEDALKAFSILYQKDNNYHFWVIGKGESNYVSYLENSVKSDEIRKNIKFFGFVSQEKKFELLSRAHILVNPSIREGWGLVNIEANTVGTPVVSYKSQGLVDSVKDNQSGVFCKKNNPQSMSETVDAVLSDKTLYERLSRGAKRWANMFSWEKSIKLSLKILEDTKNS